MTTMTRRRTFVCYAHAQLVHIGAPCGCFHGGPAPEYPPAPTALARWAGRFAPARPAEATVPAVLDVLDARTGGAR